MTQSQIPCKASFWATRSIAHHLVHRSRRAGWGVFSCFSLKSTPLGMKPVGGPKRQFVLSVVAKSSVHRREAGWGPRISKPQSRHSYSCLKRPPVRQLHYILIMLSTKIPTGQRTGQIAPFANDLRPVGHSTISTHAEVLGHNLASGGCQPTELTAFDSEGLRRSARRVCGDRGRHSPDCESCDYAISFVHGCLCPADVGLGSCESNLQKALCFTRRRLR